MPRHNGWAETEVADPRAGPTLGGAATRERSAVTGGAMALRRLDLLLPAAFAAGTVICDATGPGLVAHVRMRDL